MDRSPKLLPSQALLKVVLDAFRASRDGAADVTCVLRGRTVRGGLAGRCRPRHWCCPLTAFLRFLIDDGLVELAGLPDAMPVRLVLFVPLAAEMLRWDVQAQATKLPPLCPFASARGRLFASPRCLDRDLRARSDRLSVARRYLCLGGREPAQRAIASAARGVRGSDLHGAC